MNTPHEPTPVRDLFGQPITPPAELVRVEQPPPMPVRPEPDDATPEVQAAAAETRQRLLAHCQQLRTAHRCPGRCVLTGELGRGGLSAFRQIVDGSS